MDQAKMYRLMARLAEIDDGDAWIDFVSGELLGANWGQSLAVLPASVDDARKALAIGWNVMNNVSIRSVGEALKYQGRDSR